jgi:hypothetical protein
VVVGWNHPGLGSEMRDRALPLPAAYLPAVMNDNGHMSYSSSSCGIVTLTHSLTHSLSLSLSHSLCRRGCPSSDDQDRPFSDEENWDPKDSDGRNCHRALTRVLKKYRQPNKI